MREGTLRDRGLRSLASGLSLPLAAIAALICGGLTDAHAANPAPTASFTGATSQHAGSYGKQRLPSNSVAFTYTGGSVTNFDIPWVVRCFATSGGPSAPLVDRIEFLNPLPVKNGSFATDGTYYFPPGRHQAASVQITVNGTIRGSQASGTVVVSAEIDWQKHYAPGQPVPIVDKVAFCGNGGVTIHWSAVATSSPTNLAFPELARPQVRPQPLAYVLFARTRAGTGTSSIYSTWRDGPPSWRLIQPPPGASDSSPATAAGKPLVAFQRTTGGTTQIFAKEVVPLVNRAVLVSPGVDPHAAGGMQLTNFPVGADDPAVAPNGQEIAFSVGTGADCSLWLMDKSGDAQRQLTGQATGPECDDEPAWSPDGRFIAFRRTQADASGGPSTVTYMIIPATGGAAQELNLPAGISGLNWAPGRKLVFISSGGPGSLPGLHTANPDGSGEVTILTARGLTGRPAWSPRNGTIAFARRERNGRTDIATVPASGGRVTDITDTPGASESDPVWSVPLLEISPGTFSPPLHVISRPPSGRRRHR